MLLQPNTARNRVFNLGTGLTGVTVTISKDGATFVAPAGTLTQIGSTAWYKLALTAADTNTPGDLAYIFTATAGTPNQPTYPDEVSAPVKLADGVTHGGTASILSLKQQILNNPTGTALDIQGGLTGNNAPTINIQQLGNNGNAITVNGNQGAALELDSGGNYSVLIQGGAQGISVYGNDFGINLAADVPINLNYGAGNGNYAIGFRVSKNAYPTGINNDAVRLEGNTSGHDINLAGDGKIWDNVINTDVTTSSSSPQLMALASSAGVSAKMLEVGPVTVNISGGNITPTSVTLVADEKHNTIDITLS